MDLLLIGIIIIVPLIADLNVKLTYKRYLKKESHNDLTGADVAREILKKHNLDLYVVETTGFLSDHYDPSQKVVRLSKDVYNGSTIASHAIAAHEVGHAIQDQEGYKYMRFRSKIYPVVNIATTISYYIIVLGLVFSLLKLFYLGIVFSLFGLLFQVVTLPVEFNASKRGKKELEEMNLREKGTDKVLKSAALTYVAGVLASALQILRFILMARDRN